MKTQFNSLVLMAAVGIASALAQPAQPAQPIQIVPVKGNIYMLAGAGGNIVISVGPDGVLLVDSGLAANADKVLAAINRSPRRSTSAECR